MITIDEFIQRRKLDWELLARMSEQARRRGFSSMSPEELERFSRLYRRATGDLARAQTRYRDPDLVCYLNQLVGQAHGQIYTSPVIGPRQILRFFLFGFPEAVRDNWRSIGLSTAMTLAAVLIGFIAVAVNPETNGRAIIPGIFLESIEDRAVTPRGSIPPELCEVFASFILTNNLKVGFTAFATGVLWGVPTVWVLLWNGMMLGGLSAIFHSRHVALAFWSLILPHGVLELAAIFICGGAGLILGQSMIAPGDYLRKDALVLAGRRAVRLVVGCVPLFIIAAIIESYITPSPLPPSLKLSLAAFTAVGLLAYISLKESSRGR